MNGSLERAGFGRRNRRVVILAASRGVGEKHQGSGHVNRAVASVSIQSVSAELQHHAQQDPDLPVREKARDPERSRDAHVGSQPPESENIRHQRGGRQQSAESERYVTVLLWLPPQWLAASKPDPDTHNDP